MIKIQHKDFNIQDEIDQINSKHSNIGAVSIFVGYVKNINNQQKVTSINLEVYRDMAHKSLEEKINLFKISKKMGRYRYFDCSPLWRT